MPAPSELAAQLLLTRPALPCGRRVVAVDGPSGAGKTTFAAALRAELAGRLPRPGDVAVVPLEPVYPGWDGLEAGVIRFVAGVLRPLGAGAPTGVLPRWDWAADRDGEPEIITLHAVTVVEGVGAGARAGSGCLTLLVWVDAPPELRRARALARDGETFAPHWQRWAAQEVVHFAQERTRQRADVIVDGAASGGSGLNRVTGTPAPR